MNDFDMVVDRSCTTAVVQLLGELDLHTAPLLQAQLLSLAEDGVVGIAVDMTELDFIDSSGQQALVEGRKRLREEGGQVSLRSPKPSTLRVLEITGLTSLFRVEGADGAGAANGSGTAVPVTNIAPAASEAALAGQPTPFI